MSTEYPFRSSVAELIVKEARRSLTLRPTFDNIRIAIQNTSSIPPNSKKQYLTQLNHILGMFVYFHGISRDIIAGSYIEFFLGPERFICENNCTQLIQYVKEFMKAVGKSNSSIVAFLSTLAIFGDLYSWSRFRMLDNARFPYDKVQQLIMEYNLPVQERALEQVAIVPTQQELYEKILANFEPATLERALLTIITYTPIRDDFNLLFLDGERDLDFTIAEHAGKNLFLYEDEENMKIVLQQTKTFGKKYYKDTTLVLHPNVCKECSMFFAMIGIKNIAGKYPFGKIKRSQDFIRWTEKMGLFLQLRQADGSYVTRGAGIDYFRRVNFAAKDTIEGQAEVAKAMGHTATTHLKYRAIALPRPTPSSSPLEHPSSELPTD